MQIKQKIESHLKLKQGIMLKFKTPETINLLGSTTSKN